MTTLRNQMKTILWILVFAFLATIVFSWGMGGFKESDPEGVIAKFAGETITAGDFESYLQRKEEQARMKDSTGLDESKLKQLREDAWDEEIERQLKELDAKRLGIDVSDAEIAYIVEHFPPNEVRQVQSFQRDGRFAPDLYLAFLRTPEASQFLLSLEASVKNYLLDQKLQFYVNQAANVSELNILDQWYRGTAQGKLRFAMIPFDRADVDSNSISDEMLRRYYNLFPDRFKQYAQRRFAYVKFKIEPSGEDSTEVRTTAAELMQELRNGADFEQMASIHSEDQSSAAKGGDVGWFGRGAMVREFEQAAYAANPGDLVGPVESKFGVHVIRVEEKRTEDGNEKVRARQILIKFDASPDTREGTFSVAYAFAQDCKEHGFDQVSQQSGLPVDTTKAFSEAGYIGGLGRMRMAAEFCFNNPVGSVSEVYPVPDGYVVFKIVEATEEGNKSFEEVKDQIRKSVLKILRQQKANDVAADLRSKMTGGSDLSSVAAAAGYSVYETADSAKPDDRLPEGLRSDKDFITEAFRLKADELSGVIEGRNGCYIAYMIYKTPYAQDNYESNHFAIYGELIGKEAEAVNKNWIRELRIAADIQDYRYKYYRDF